MIRLLFISVTAFALIAGSGLLLGQTDMKEASLMLPDTTQSLQPQIQDVVINHAMIKKFNKANFTAGQKGFRSMMMTYNLDSMKVALENYMKRDVGFVSGKETDSTSITSENSRD